MKTLFDMPRYYPIRQLADPVTKTRTIDRLLTLREKLAEEVDPHRNPGSFLLATWNIREFGRSKPKHGDRVDEAFHYIAEIISRFHLVALQEVNRDLTDFRRLLMLLGPDWDGILTDVTEGTGGNEERMAFVYDKRVVSFRNVAGEIVLPTGKRVAKDGQDDELQFARTPFMVSFQAGWFKFNLCTVHIYYGAASGTKLQRRIQEIEKIARFFKDR
ncbi:MAG: endonuclease/exonuclease/phosphatase family protein, partial [Myxococcota bacterium]